MPSLGELRAKRPNVETESCSGGGGRVDLGVMRYTDQMWSSGNTHAFDRLTIQNGFTDAYSPGLLEDKLSPGTSEEAGGAYWMQHGFDLELLGDLQAAVLTLDAVSAQ